jgi:nucleoid-associated protein YgaU
MHRDYKIGVLVGTIAAAIAAGWLSTLSLVGEDTVASPLPAPPSAARISVDHGDTRAERPEAAPSPSQTITTIHIVQEGETLSQISERYYDTTGKWQVIVEANKDRISNPDRLRPGTRLVIPD